MANRIFVVILSSFLMAQHNIKGIIGEEQALGFLRAKGYEILEVNWRFLHLETDIIAMDKVAGKLVFIEVKTRSDTQYGAPELAVTLKKQKNLIRAANFYIDQINYNGESRFDIITVLDQPDGSFEINHIDDAFYPTL